MNWQRKLVACFAALMVAGWGNASLGLAAAQDERHTGYFEIIWGDGTAGSGPTEETYWLDDGAGLHLRLDLEPELAQPWGGLLALNGRRLTVTGTRPALAAQAGEAHELQVQSLEPLDGLRAANLGAQALTGSQPWVSIMCQFPDRPASSKTLAYFQGMYANTYPALDHYWREVSYNNINVEDSTAVGWYTLPQPRSYYVPSGSLDFNRAASDCTALADAAVDFRPFMGINLMLNDIFDSTNNYAWGGGEYLTLDGVSKTWRMTWEPPWGWSNIGVIAHEMGHGFGLPHSSGMYGATYDNYWDVMSNTWIDWTPDAEYGSKGQHTNSAYKDQLGWIASAQKYTFPSRWTATLTLERLALPQAGHYQFINIPTCTWSRFYSVEARRKTGYDSILPGEGIIIHKVQSGYAYVVDTNAQDNQNRNTMHANFGPGSAYVNTPDGFSVTVNSATASGYVVTVSSTAPCAVPDPPTLLNPANGSFGPQGPVGFFWQPSAVPGQTLFSFLLSASPLAETQSWLLYNDRFATSTRALTYTFSADGVYYWSMRAWNSGGMSSGWISRTITIDTVAPSSLVGGLPANSLGVFAVSWSGADATSGIAGYDVQYQDGAGPWTFWQTNTPLTQAVFVGLKNHVYSFRSRATDRAGNVEAWPGSADASTAVTADPVHAHLPVVAR